MLIWNFYSNVPRELGRFLGDVSGMAEYVTSRESVLFCRHSSCWMLRMGPNKWKRVRHQRHSVYATVSNQKVNTTRLPDPAYRGPNEKSSVAGKM